MSILSVKDLSHQIMNKVLYEDCSFEVYKNEHLGIVGQNGTGKTTLINILTNQIVPDSGEITWQRGLKIGFLDQHAHIEQDIVIFDFLKLAFKGLYDDERELNGLYEKMVDDSSDQLNDRISLLQERLSYSGFYDLEPTIHKVAKGLGIDAIGIDKKMSQISGGQRAKVILAKLLLESPDVLLLDEPTNFLDKEHVEWLKNFLKQFPGNIIVISHDFSFLDHVTNCIIDIEFHKMIKYTGSFNQFKVLKAVNRQSHIQQYEKQQDIIKRNQEFIARNAARASTASRAQSRQKMLDKMEKIPPAQNLPKPTFVFKPITLPYAPTALFVNGLTVGYTKPLLSNLTFKIAPTEKIVITGFNGIGKSTTLKTITALIPPLSGSFKWTNHIEYAYFEQDLLWDDPQQTPFDVIKNAYPQYDDGEVRKHLAVCALKGKLAMQPVSSLSGGEQAKVKICLLMLKKANFLILDEPTNHLDAECKQVLKDQLRNYKGGIILVTHEASFYEGWIDKVLKVTTKALKIE